MAGSSATSELVFNSKVLILDTPNIAHKYPQYIGQIGTIVQVPVHPITWYKIKFSDGKIVTYRLPALRSISGRTYLIDLPLNIERDVHVPKLKNSSASEHRLKNQQGRAMEMDECEQAKPLVGFAVATGQLGFSIDGSSEHAEEALLSNFSRKRARLASLLAASNECTARREAPFRPPQPGGDGGKSLMSKLPIQCGPNLSFHTSGSLSASSAESFFIDKNDSAQSGFLASNLYGLMDDEHSSSSSSSHSSSSLKSSNNSSHPRRTEGLEDNTTPDPRFLSYMSYIASEKTAKEKSSVDKSIFLRRFDKSGLIALGILVEELARDIMLTWAQRGHPLIANTKRSISTALDLQIQGMAAISKVRSNTDSEPGASSDECNHENDDNVKDESDDDIKRDLKRALKSMLSVMFMAKEKKTPEISQVIDTLVENLDSSVFANVNPKNIVSASANSINRTSDALIPKSKVISTSKVLAQIHTDKDYRVCSYCSIVIEGRQNFSDHVKSVHGDAKNVD